MRTILFHRKYRRFHGGHLKVWHYFNHVLATPGFDARVYFDVNSSWDSSNPWTQAREYVVESTADFAPAALFVAGRDWQRFDALGLLDGNVPILNLIQHVRHTEEWSIQARYLDRRAIRLCVSPEVAEAVMAAGSRGPVVVIPNGVDIPPDAETVSRHPVDLLIAGLKHPVLAARAAEELAAPGRAIHVLTEHVPREQFVAAMREARVALFLPNEVEGFYLPALEGMALGTLVVCPDCVGNRSFVLPGVNALRPAYDLAEIIAAARSALELPKGEVETLRANALETARSHSLDAECEAFGRVLSNLYRLWAIP
ncbi:MAG: glycosyltransferase [Chloroflexota bacterium]|nr:glycosyltransferase [Chloroflexota bacterium]